MKFLFLLASVLLTITTNVQAFSGVGRGVAVDPYVITSCAELEELLKNTNAFYKINGSFTCGDRDLTRLNRNKFFVVVREPITLENNAFFIVIMNEQTELIAFHINPEDSN